MSTASSRSASGRGRNETRSSRSTANQNQSGHHQAYEQGWNDGRLYERSQYGAQGGNDYDSRNDRNENRRNLDEGYLTNNGYPQGNNQNQSEETPNWEASDNRENNYPRQRNGRRENRQPSNREDYSARDTRRHPTSRNH